MIKIFKYGVFDLIAPIYGLFYKYQKRLYSKALDMINDDLELSKYINIIDLGCGTGALCSVLNQRGLEVTGVDIEPKMLKIAQKKKENKGIDFVQANILLKLPYKEKSFDISTASYVAHGMKANERMILYSEMSRITKHLVIVYDYNSKRSIMTNIIEWLEKGDYFNFIKVIRVEMEEQFADVRGFDVKSKASLYLCIPKDN